MRTIKIASAAPFEGAPRINLASVFGASPKKPLLLRVPVTGERPIEYSAEGLPEGLSLNGNIISGTVDTEGDYEITLYAKNAKGRAEKRVTLEIKPENVLVTPLMGFTTWSAFGSAITQEKIEGIAERLIELGIAEYGYRYVNTDSGWQHEYGGEFDAVMPNEKFPDMKAMTDRIHALGFNCGIYSTPMLTAWGCPKELKSIPGCTVGDPDPRFASTNGGIGLIHKEKNNALQWEKWGFDYLKYDWRPTDTVNAELMRSELMKTSRDFGFCVTVEALKEYHEYWSKYCNSYRSNTDAHGFWSNFMEIYRTYFTFMEYVNKGHYFDLDMLDIGTCTYKGIRNELTEDESIVAYSMRAFLNSPIQISSTLENISDLELSIYCNEEIIAINQDCAFRTALPIFRANGGDRLFDVFEKQLEDGAYAYAFFNVGERSEDVSVALEAVGVIRDVWAKENIGESDKLELSMAPHTVRIVKTANKISNVALK